MKIGINFQLTDSTPHPVELARRCEALGFESMFVNEHVIFPTAPKTLANPSEPIPEYYAHFLEPFIALAMAAVVTTTLKLGTCISLVAEHEPIALAKEIATEYLRAMKELWTKPEASFDGEFVSFPPVKCYPKPAHKPHPPIHMGAGGLGTAAIERALRNTVALGDGWMPAGLRPEQLRDALRTLKRMCEEAGRDFNAIEISANVPPLKKSAARDAIEQYEAAGAHRVTTILAGSAFDQDPVALEKAADAFLG